jgi:hypothetical protein
MTPKIAEAVWESLSKEQRYDLLDIDDMWHSGYDDDMRMRTVEKVLLVYTGTDDDPLVKNQEAEQDA